MSSSALQLASSHDAFIDARASLASHDLGSPGCGDTAKAHKSAVEFESILLASWLEKMQQTIQTLPGDEQDPGADTFQSLGVQAISGALAARGGLGIANMIEKHLSPACPVDTRHQGNPVGYQVGVREADGETSADIPSKH